MIACACRCKCTPMPRHVWKSIYTCGYKCTHRRPEYTELYTHRALQGQMHSPYTHVNTHMSKQASLPEDVSEVRVPACHTCGRTSFLGTPGDPGQCHLGAAAAILSLWQSWTAGRDLMVLLARPPNHVQSRTLGLRKVTWQPGPEPALVEPRALSTSPWGPAVPSHVI